LQEGHEALLTPQIHFSLQTALGSPASEPKDTSGIRPEKSSHFAAPAGAQLCSLCMEQGDAAGRTECPCPPPVCPISHPLPGDRARDNPPKLI